jgi:hypothetical protein
MNGDMNSSNDTTCINVTYQPGVGLHEIVRGNGSWTLYPNPASDDVRILGMNDQRLPNEWLLTDATGREFLVGSEQESEQQIRLDLRGLADGVYYLRARSEAGRALPLFIRR